MTPKKYYVTLSANVTDCAVMEWNFKLSRVMPSATNNHVKKIMEVNQHLMSKGNNTDCYYFEMVLFRHMIIHVFLFVIMYIAF